MASSSVRNQSTSLNQINATRKCAHGESQRGDAEIFHRSALIEPREIRVDENTWQFLQKLCQEMTNTNGLVMAVLEMALSINGEEREDHLRRATALSTRGAEALKKFTWQWEGLLKISLEGQGTGDSGGVSQRDRSMKKASD